MNRDDIRSVKIKGCDVRSTVTPIDNRRPFSASITRIGRWLRYFLFAKIFGLLLFEAKSRSPNTARNAQGSPQLGISYNPSIFRYRNGSLGGVCYCPMPNDSSMCPKSTINDMVAIISHTTYIPFVAASLSKHSRQIALFNIR